jgi:hypothetical protein
MSNLNSIDVKPASLLKISSKGSLGNLAEYKYTIVIPDIINDDGFRKKQTYKVFFKFHGKVNTYVISKTYRDFDELRENILNHIKTNEREQLDTYKILFADKLRKRSDYWSNKHTKDYKESSISKRALKRSIKLTNFLRLMLHGPELLMDSTNMSHEDNSKIRGLNVSNAVKDILYEFLGLNPLLF